MAEVNQKGIIANTTKQAVANKHKPQTLKDYIKVYKGEFAKALPSVITPERFGRIATTALTNTPKLEKCTPQSFVGALLIAAQLGVEPNTALGQAYLIPYGNQCQFQLGYKGMLDLAYRTGEVRSITAEVVREGDLFEYELGLNPKLRHVPAQTGRGKPIFYYAVFKLVNGGEGFQVMSYEDVMEHAKKYSKTFNNGPWQSAFDEMAKKTVLKKLLKYMPLKTEFVKAVAQDETIKNFDVGEDNRDILDKPNEWVDADVNIVDEDTGEVKE